VLLGYGDRFLWFLYIFILGPVWSTAILKKKEVFLADLNFLKLELFD